MRANMITASQLLEFRHNIPLKVVESWNEDYHHQDPFFCAEIITQSKKERDICGHLCICAVVLAFGAVIALYLGGNGWVSALTGVFCTLGAALFFLVFFKPWSVWQAEEHVKGFIKVLHNVQNTLDFDFLRPKAWLSEENLAEFVEAALVGRVVKVIHKETFLKENSEDPAGGTHMTISYALRELYDAYQNLHGSNLTTEDYSLMIARIRKKIEDNPNLLEENCFTPQLPPDDGVVSEPDARGNRTYTTPRGVWPLIAPKSAAPA